MESEYIICMDVSGDIDADVAAQHNLKFIPMEYSLGEEMRTCAGIESSDILKRFYDGQRGGNLTRTSQISPYMYETYLTEYFEQGYSVLYLCLSSGLSSTYSSACMAKTQLEEQFPGQKFLPVDTLAATGGMGVLAERAIRNREKGLSIEENYQDLIAAVGAIRHWFVVPDLMYLKRGGRVSAVSAVVGSALNVKPILKVDEQGKLVTISKKRGDRAAICALLDHFRETYTAEGEDVIYVIDADAPKLGDMLEKGIRDLYPDAVIRRSTLCPVIGAHTGPGMAAICHMGK